MEQKKTIIGYVSSADPFTDKKAWSGLIYKIRESVEQSGCKVIWIPMKIDYDQDFVNKIRRKLCMMTRHANFEYTTVGAKLLAKSIDLKLLDQCDALFFPANGFVRQYIQTDKPTIYYTDGTFRLMGKGYYWNMSDWEFRQADSLQCAGHRSSRINIGASKWAINSIVNDYHADAEHSYVLEFGANLDEKDIVRVKPYQEGTLHILFSGVDWERKGAAIAIHTVDLLNERGIDAKLLLCGIKETPPEFQGNPHVEYIGFLNKNYPEQYQKYIDTIKKSHIFLLPTKAECAGVVFAEASAYGMPILTYDTGGIANYVVNGVNGIRLPLTEDEHGFADKIQELLTADGYLKLQQGGLKLYQERLSWSAWSRNFRTVLEKENLLKITKEETSV